AAPRRDAASLGLLAAALVLVSVVNPYGPRLLEFPFSLTGSSFMGEIYAWLPALVAVHFRNFAVTLSPYASTYMALYYVLWIGFGLLSFGLAAARWRGGRLLPQGCTFAALLFAAFLILSLRMNRNVADFALATFPGVVTTFAAAVPFARRPGPAVAPSRADDRRRSLLPWIAAALLLAASWFAVAGYSYSPALRRRTG